MSNEALTMKSAAANQRLRVFGKHNLEQISQLTKLPPERLEEIKVVAEILPFRANNYVVDQLIDWSNPDDEILTLTFPRREMLIPDHFDKISRALKTKDSSVITKTANDIRLQLNPHPAGQMELNRPTLANQVLEGVQHKYGPTVLFFPEEGQTCHAYCTFCFRWPQFVGDKKLRFASKGIETLISYLRLHPEVSDVLFTGGDPLVMSVTVLNHYLSALIAAEIPSLKTIRIGTKALSYWPYRFITDRDSSQLLSLFRRVVDSGIHLAIMAHVNHVRELETEIVRQAVTAVRATGAEIRSQSPILRKINDSPKAWSQMWTEQVAMGIIPYYMFVPRDTGAQHFFAVSLASAISTYQQAIRSVSGLARTARGPSMSCTPGKIEILGVEDLNGSKVFVLRFLQARDPTWSYRPFFAKFDDQATWFDELRPAFGEPTFFFE